MKAKLLGADAIGTWKDGVLILNESATVLEGRLVTEPAEKGKIKYTLTGTRTIDSAFLPEPTPKSGWYAQIVAEPPAPPRSDRRD